MSFVHCAWSQADEEGRYQVWSTYYDMAIRTMGSDFPVESYSAFCDAMDKDAAEAGYPSKINSLYSIGGKGHKPVHLRRK